ncbi:hypothetical protein [Caloramator sp. ALD01]|uniref:hypothetical protein n=1 Tax=Caloramator sp. ALD01 TaxID=1031288 RepID=UPI000421BE9B|nr:hypothetical protein [Caloramator sp. ALD01]
MRKTFDIKDEDVLKHLEMQVNQTQYIISLIKKDMNNKAQVIDKEMIIAIIEEYLSRKDRVNKVDVEVKNSINSVLNMLKSTK